MHLHVQCDLTVATSVTTLLLPCACCYLFLAVYLPVKTLSYLSKNLFLMVVSDKELDNTKAKCLDTSVG